LSRNTYMPGVTNSFIKAGKRLLHRTIPRSLERQLKTGWNSVLSYHDKLCSVDKKALRSTLEDVGVRSGEIVFVHSAYDRMRSIQATPVEMIEIFCESVGHAGTIVMPTFPREELYQIIKQGGDCQHALFDCRRTPSYSGYLTEIFRRMPESERSLHPTHPVAARGAAAAWVTAGHERSRAPFDEHSPFHKLHQCNAMILRIGRFKQGAMTFRHLADHLIQDELPYPVYSEKSARVPVIGKDGKEHVLLTKALNRDLSCNHLRLLDRMAREGSLTTVKIGAVPLSMVRVQTYVEAYQRFYRQGVIRHYPRSPAATSRAAGWTRR
jgi:aminoglycoside N3'-acetyltransferase